MTKKKPTATPKPKKAVLARNDGRTGIKGKRQVEVDPTLRDRMKPGNIFGDDTSRGA